MRRLVINTERLILKPINAESFNDFKNIVCDSSVSRYYMLPKFKDDSEVMRMHERFIKLTNNENIFFYGAYLNDELIGFINQVDITENRIELGYVISPKHQNKGYCTEMLKECINELFNLGYNTVRCGFFEQNTASKRVMEKCNMQRISFEEDIEYNGNLYHCIYYDITK